MRENVGNTDRAVRMVAGPLLIGWGATRLGDPRRRLLGIAAMVGGAMIAETALTRVCPVNAVLGLDTRGSHGERRAALRADSRQADADETESMLAAAAQAPGAMPMVM